jgi:hypothetical protein
MTLVNVGNLLSVISQLFPKGAAAAAACNPVVLAAEQTQDLLITGAAAQSALGNNILLSSAGTAGIDTLAPGSNAPSYRAFTCQIVASGGISAGAVIFEGSNDGTNWSASPYFQEANNAFASASATNVAASANMFFTGAIYHRYLRCRISTAFVGGTVQAFTRLMVTAPPARLVGVSQGTPAFLAMTNTPATPTANVLTTAASTNATSVKNGAGNLYAVTLTNPTATPAYVKLYNKASAPTVGTDVPVAVFPVPANSDVVREFGAVGQRFSTGIALAVTGAIGDSDTSNAVAGVHSMLSYI